MLFLSAIIKEIQYHQHDEQDEYLLEFSREGNHGWKFPVSSTNEDPLGVEYEDSFYISASVCRVKA